MWLREEKLGVAKGEEGEIGRRRGRASYIDEGRARRLPRDHKVESGGAKPCWGGGRVGASKQKGDGVAPSNCVENQTPGMLLLQLRPSTAGARPLRAATAVPGTHLARAQNTKLRRVLTTTTTTRTVTPRAFCSRRAVYSNKPQTPPHTCFNMAYPCRLSALIRPITHTQALHAHYFYTSKGTTSLKIPRVTRLSHTPFVLH